MLMERVFVWSYTLTVIILHQVITFQSLYPNGGMLAIEGADSVWFVYLINPLILVMLVTPTILYARWCYHGFIKPETVVEWFDLVLVWSIVYLLVVNFESVPIALEEKRKRHEHNVRVFALCMDTFERYCPSSVEIIYRSMTLEDGLVYCLVHIE